MALVGPSLRNTRAEDLLEGGGGAVSRALRLAREVEDLLAAPSVESLPDTAHAAHSTRIARAMAASLVDELEAIQSRARASATVAAARRSGSA